MNPALKNGILIVVLLLVVGLAFYFYSRNTGEEALPTSDEYATHWMDEETEERFSLSPAELRKWQTTPGKLRAPDDSAGGGVMAMGPTQMVFKNDSTGKYSIVRATIHGPTGKWYIERDSRGRDVPIPKWLIDYETQAAQGGG
ncbi:MAG: hypothetical protein IPM18_00635 [Phycisphaerales bacterium]|nr:hypothetical protein [Phycisphaerales bacterium]